MGYQTEEEQVEALKKWWRDSGTSILAGVVLAVAVVFGWQGWQKHTLQQQVAASHLYQQLSESWSLVSEQETDEKAAATFRHLAGKLQEEHEGSVYAHLGTLQLARYLVEQGDLEGAKKALNWVLEHDAPDYLAEAARLRLAQVLFAQENLDGALALLEAHEPVALQAEWDELRGDLLLQMDRRSEAVAAYRRASEIAESLGQRRPLLELKLDDLAAAAEEA